MNLRVYKSVFHALCLLCLGSSLAGADTGSISAAPVPPGLASAAAVPAGPGSPAAVSTPAVDVAAPDVLNTAGARENTPEASSSETFFNTDSDAEASASDRSRKKVSSVSRQLKQFGYDFFRRGGGFDPDQLALVGPEYVLGPGDNLRIDIWGSVEGNYQFTLDRNGEIALPKVGVINLWGQTFAEAKETIRRQISKYFTNFEVNVTMGALRSIQVYIVGEVNSPGTYRISSLSTVLTALSTAGGPARTGSLRAVRLVREGKTVGEIDFYQFFLRGDRSKDVRLQSGDTLFVPPVGPLVAVAGNVQRPAIYELKGENKLGDVLQLAGGMVPSAYLQKVQIERIEAHDRKVVIDLDLQDKGETAALEFELRDRDMVQIAPIAFSGGYVVLEGYVVRPGSYQLRQGMRLADLILPYDNLLPEFFPGMAQIIRLNPPEFRPQMLTINLEKALAGDPEHNLLLQEYDTVRLFSRREMEELPQVTVSGAVLNPGKFRLFDNMTVRDLLASAGNLKRSAYLAEAEITRYVTDGKEVRTERLLVDLDKALRGEGGQNLPLQADDHLFVRAIPDFGERMTVEIRGEVLFPGTYAIAKGETLGSVLTRAGGFTDRAYLRGAHFSRESLKEIQRQRLQQLIAEQEQQVYQLSAEIAQGAMGEEDLKAAQAILESRRQLLTKLKQAPVSGRLVIHLSAAESFRGSKADFELMAGDTLVVPRNPQAVTVLGEVYNPTSLVYEPNRSVAYYLDKVGGVTKDAEEDEVFVVRADGTVISKQQSGFGLRWERGNGRWVMGSFDIAELYPGDTVLVPEKLQKVDWLKETKDVTTILYQMALGAAAVMAF